MMFQLDIFIHMDAVDRKAWQGAPDDRPLTDLGKRQSELIRQWQPWRKSTGPSTTEGKRRSARNAFKGGTRATLHALAQALRECRQNAPRG